MLKRSSSPQAGKTFIVCLSFSRYLLHPPLPFLLHLQLCRDQFPDVIGYVQPVKPLILSQEYVQVISDTHPLLHAADIKGYWFPGILWNKMALLSPYLVPYPLICWGHGMGKSQSPGRLKSCSLFADSKWVLLEGITPLTDRFPTVTFVDIVRCLLRWTFGWGAKGWWLIHTMTVPTTSSSSCKVPSGSLSFHQLRVSISTLACTLWVELHVIKG